MEDHGLRRAFLVQHPQQILIGFAIVNHQRLTETLRQIDVPPETVDLLLDGGAPLELAGPVEVEPRLPHGNDSWIGRQPLDLGSRAGIENVCPGRMDCDGCVDSRIPMSRFNCKSRGIKVVGHRDDSSDADGLGSIDYFGHGHSVVRTTRVEVRMGVDQRRQGLRGIGGGTVFAHAR